MEITEAAEANLRWLLQPINALLSDPAVWTHLPSGVHTDRQRTRDELQRLIRFCLERDIRPTVHATMPLASAREGFQAMHDGDHVGKIVFTT